jgi:hypothetical protein
MRRTRSAAGAVLIAAVLSSCGAAASDSYVIHNDPGHVEAIPGRDEGLVTLTEAAVKRLKIQTTGVVDTGKRLMVPDEAVLVDTDGRWWVFTSPEPHHFVREEIQLRRQRAGQAWFSAGPPAGTQVVVVGVAELYGVEQAVGH